MTTGNISVQTENIFPIIKKFLYSDQEIFLRELVSNAVDATTKVQTLAKRGEVAGEIGTLRVQVLLDKKKKTLTIRDNGIGMTGDEARRYLSDVAFSSASEFLEKYQEGNIIGHFGLGFYSAFMVATKVEVVSKSYKSDETAIRWTCEGTPQYTLEDVEKKERGTDVILHIGDEEKDYLDNNRIEDLLNKYCRFLPVEIQFGTRREKPEGAKKETDVPNIINDTHPIWKKQPSELTAEDYEEFYNELYPLSPSPMFWIHLNIDFPFNLTGILYFPKLSHGLEGQKNKVQLYCNQVFVTDDVKQILPEFLTVLHGVIDSPDIPLNVSRSYLQSDREVKKITTYITKKVADKMSELFHKDRAEYNRRWLDIGVFIKYGMLSDDKFDERAREFALFKNTEGEFFTIEEYRAKIAEQQTDKNGRLTVIYTNNMAAHDAQIQAARRRGYDVLEMENSIDNHFMQHLEYRMDKIAFVRVDSETIDNLVGKDQTAESVLSADEEAAVKAAFTPFIEENYYTSIVLKPLLPDEQPVQITRSEFTRRMNEMRKFSATDLGGMPDTTSIVVNANNPLIAGKLLKINDLSERSDFARYLYDLARVSQGMLKGTELTAFISRSLDFLK